MSPPNSTPSPGSAVLVRLPIGIMMAFIFVAGCATTAGYELVLNTWVGDSTDHLISSWGIPTNKYSLNDGGVVLEYQRSNTIVLPGITTTQPVATTYENGSVSGYSPNGGAINGSYNGTATTYAAVTSPPTVINQQCLTRFTADRSGRIVRWSWQGNSCRAKAPKQVKTATQTTPPTYKKCSADQIRDGNC